MDCDNNGIHVNIKVLIAYVSKEFVSRDIDYFIMQKFVLYVCLDHVVCHCYHMAREFRVHKILYLL